MEKLKKLTSHIDDLIKLISDNHTIPKYKNLKICVNPYERKDHKNILYKSKFQNIENFEEEFINIQKQGHAWINLTLGGIYNDSLVFILELPQYKNNIPFGETSVNLSGPSLNVEHRPKWQLEDIYKIL